MSRSARRRAVFHSIIAACWVLLFLLYTWSMDAHLTYALGLMFLVNLNVSVVTSIIVAQKFGKTSGDLTDPQPGNSVAQTNC